MDGSLLGLIIALIKSVPDSASAEAVAAADRAETAAQAAEERAYGLSVSGTTLQFEQPTNG